MGEDTKNDEPKAIKLNLPKDFSGKREDLKKFLQQVNLYMDINANIYHNDMTKIAFILSFMMKEMPHPGKNNSLKKERRPPPMIMAPGWILKEI